MKTLSLILILTISLGACNTSSGDKKSASQNNSGSAPTEKELNTLSTSEIQEGWQLLFDGKTTSGWRGFKQEDFPDKGWHVVDGTLMIEYSGTGEQGFAGDIITDETFRNFDLKCEWKISKGGNSGILIYVTENDEYEATWHTAHEIQILDAFGYDDVHDYVPNLRQISGALYDLYTPPDAAAKPVGEWNEARIKITDGHLQHWLNDSLVIYVHLWTDEWQERVSKSKFSIYPDFGLAKEGHIGLQDHGQQVWFRNIKIRELE